MKKLFLGTIVFLFLGYCVMDHYGYYYGLGSGFLSVEIPDNLRILFAGSDLGNQGIIIEENIIGGVYLIRNNGEVYLKSVKKEVKVKKFLGYYFTRKDFLAKILNIKDEIIYIRIIPYPEDSIYRGQSTFIVEKEVKNGYCYINLNKNISYFKRFKLIKKMLFFCNVLCLIIYFYLHLFMSYNSKNRELKIKKI